MNTWPWRVITETVIYVLNTMITDNVLMVKYTSTLNTVDTYTHKDTSTHTHTHTHTCAYTHRHKHVHVNAVNAHIIHTCSHYCHIEYMHICT